MNCICEHYDDWYCNHMICSKFLSDEKNRKHEMRNGESENFLVDE